MDDKSQYKIVFEPGSFADFDGTQEELDELVKAITDFIHSDEFESAIEDGEEMDEVEAENILNNFNKSGSSLLH